MNILWDGMRTARNPESSPLLRRRDECADDSGGSSRSGAPPTDTNDALFRRRCGFSATAMMKAAGILGATILVAAIVSSRVLQGEDFASLERVNMAPAAGQDNSRQGADTTGGVILCPNQSPRQPRPCICILLYV